MQGTGGISRVARYITVHEQIHLLWVYYFPSIDLFCSDWSFFSELITFSVKCCVAAIKRLPVHHSGVVCIFTSFGNIEPICIHLKTEYRSTISKDVLAVLQVTWLLLNRLSKTESVIFVHLMCFCFQRIHSLRIFGSIVYNRSIVYRRQNFKVVIHVIIIDQ